MGCIALEDIEIGTLILKEKCRKPKIEFKDHNGPMILSVVC